MTPLRPLLHSATVWLATAALSLSAPHAAVAQANADVHCAVVDTNVEANRPAEDAVQGIYALLTAWRGALREGDIEGVTALVTEDAEFWSHGTAPLTGRPALADAFRPFLTGYELLQDFDCHELVIRGDLAFMRGMERNRLVPRDGGDTVAVEQRAFSVMRRGVDGRWRFARGMTNESPGR